MITDQRPIKTQINCYWDAGHHRKRSQLPRECDIQWRINISDIRCNQLLQCSQSRKPNVVREHVRDSNKVNPWHDLMRDRIIDPFCFMDKTVIGHIYFTCLNFFSRATPFAAKWDIPEVWQQSHWNLDFRLFLEKISSQGWIGRDGPTAWPSRSI